MKHSTPGENLLRIKKLEERVEQIEGMLDELTDELQPDIRKLHSKVETATRLQVLAMTDEEIEELPFTDEERERVQEIREEMKGT